MAEPTNPFSDLPDLMKQVLLHEENTETNLLIEKSHRLSKIQGDRMMQVIRKVILKTIKPEALVGTLQSDLGLDEVKSKKLALDLLSKRFLPMEWYLGNVRGLIHELGGNVEEALAEAKKTYPEVYAPKSKAEPTEAGSEGAEHAILRDFEDRISTMKGKAEILLRLTGLSVQVEDAVKDGSLTEEAGDRMMRDLDSVSYAVNTQDLNPFEVNSIKRKIRKILRQLGQLAA